MRQIQYDRAAASAYAQRWALGRNPAYYDFEDIGGDCTNFISQCVYAGAGVMNYTRDVGWYYRSSYDRAAAWTSVEDFFRFITQNRGAGPFGHTVAEGEIIQDDVIQLGTASGSFYHSLLVTAVRPRILLCAHTYDAMNVPLSDYYFASARYIHIDGVRIL